MNKEEYYYVCGRCFKRTTVTRIKSNREYHYCADCPSYEVKRIVYSNTLPFNPRFIKKSDYPQEYPCMKTINLKLETVNVSTKVLKTKRKYKRVFSNKLYGLKKILEVFYKEKNIFEDELGYYVEID